MKGVVIMKHFRSNSFEQNSLEQIQHGFSRTSWQINIDIAVDCGTCLAGLEPSAVQHA